VTAISTQGKGGAMTIDGVAMAGKLREQLGERVRALTAAGKRVQLDAVLVEGGDNGARVYADNQAKTCEKLNIAYRLHRLDADTTQERLAGFVRELSGDASVHAMMMHVPVPSGVDAYSVQRLIAPEKDVEGVNPANIGNIVYGRSSFAPCTALAVVTMIEQVHGATAFASRPAEVGSVGPAPAIEPGNAQGFVPLLRGRTVVVVGAGDVVGKPTAVLLMRHEATVMSCNKWTPGLSEVTRMADILVAAAGVPNLIQPEMVKPGATVIDVGVNRVTNAEGKTRTVGDVAFEQVSRVAGAISPVPGGVGPMTVTMLLRNVVEAAEKEGIGH
jgi:methylenetetrahydrofolate dehydrogenase (NADP+)/methenyltetrahydrofolate cyclohydrolase